MVPSPALRILGGMLVVAVAAMLCLEWAVRSVDIPEGLREPPPATRLLRDSDGRVFFVKGHAAARDCRPVPLGQMGDWLPGVTVGIEDRRFFQHSGVDVFSVGAATIRNLLAGRTVSGASTITQQLVKLSMPGRERTWRRKVHEALVALKLERAWEKKEILEAYLNRLDYGNRRIGPEAAALAYFGKSAGKLSLAESIYLAGLPSSPTSRNPWINRAGADRLYSRNVRNLALRGLLPPGVDVGVLAEAIPRVGRYDAPKEAVAYAGAALRAGVEQTYLDCGLQRAVEAMVGRHFARVSGFQDAAVVVVENATGRVKALAVRGSENVALRPRSAGSTLKPFVYAAALAGGTFTAASLLTDEPDAVAGVYRDYAPRNFSRRYLGRVRLREALANSLNMPAVSVLSILGARDTFHAMKWWGLDFPGCFDDYGAGFVLGNAPVSPVSLAGAYASLARGGRAWPVRWGVEQAKADVHEAVSEGAARIIADILADPRARALSFGLSSPLTLGWRAAVKTGTSSAFRDGWCAGFDGDYTVVVWVGNSNGRPLPELLAADSAAPLWADVMDELHRRGSRPWPEMKDFAVAEPVMIDPGTGLALVSGGESVVEWFLPGTAPGVAALAADAGTAALKILYPTEGQEFFLQPHLAQSRQVIISESSKPGVVWTLNGRACPDGRIPLKIGDYLLRAEFCGEVDDVRFSVR
ncbi:MAG: hypothetical protein Fur0032_02950 [Terrimicrobiaceae bacterium]